MKNIAIFASGTGSNAQKIIEHFEDSSLAKVSLVVSNKPQAKVLDKAQSFGVPTQVINRQSFYQSNEVVDLLKQHQIDLIVLAGFLWLVPQNLIEVFPQRVINIHPALLPKHGGKGMYGMKVHQAVVANKETKTGITIHYVNEHYDEGKAIFQKSCPVAPEDTPEVVAKKVQLLEHEHFPKVVEELVKNLQI
ncbi:phosphoribosylglycinamide formyltransferase [Microscilla marina]|uniref:Phosphoribosylglycinamide formyltransferase n=1 Tax=Microscilla marina ATCC 23134 TaxID=313606 RepID=A1ZQX7_MICM2|nr:phosphoribosylglycinamide formyltransferase [Microscilla marina]EAY27282.1 phosphoribosylglycinamide formyltransferase [Microscilla marina ATCC 23134]